MPTNKLDIFEEIFADDYNFYIARFTRPIEFVLRNSNNLLVTVGDNWTRGFDFGQSSAERPLPKLGSRYGEIISDQLGWDFLNISIPAMPNLWMAQKYQQICENYASLGYDRVKVIITFAEYGREFATSFDSEFPALLEQYKTCSTALEAMQAISNQIAEILTIDSPVELSVGLAYTSNLFPPSVNCLPKTWLEVLKNQTVSEPCTMLLNEFIDQFNGLAQINTAIDLAKLTNEVDQLRTTAANRRQMIYDTGYALDPDMCWPNAEAHQLWAEYILNNVDFS